MNEVGVFIGWLLCFSMLVVGVIWLLAIFVSRDSMKHDEQFVWLRRLTEIDK